MNGLATGIVIYVSVVAVVAGIWSLLIDKNGAGNQPEGKHWP